jgi:hypothetical protein
MKGMIIAAFVAVAATAGIASVGIASLANGAAILINASSHLDPRGNIAGASSDAPRAHTAATKPYQRS